MFPIIVIGPRPTVALLVTYLIGYPVAKLSFRKTAWSQKAAKDLKTKGKASIGGFSGGGGSEKAPYVGSGHR